MNKVGKLKRSECLRWIPEDIIRYNLLEEVIRRSMRVHDYAFRNVWRKKYSKVDPSYDGKIGDILTGEWDRRGVKFRNTIHFVALRERFVERKSWENTIYGKRYKAECDFGEDSEDWSHYLKRYHRWEELYDEIRENGYKPQSELEDTEIRNEEIYNRHKEGSIANEIEVVITRDGEVLLVDGIHRLAIVKILNVKMIPVVVNAVHNKYKPKIGG